MDTGIQEYVRASLPGVDATDTAAVDKSETFEAFAGGMNFRLSWTDQPGSKLQARRARALQIAVMDKAGRPVTQLEPFMNAFAHLVGFYDDGSTVVHLHPDGGDILRQDVRGGPFLNFRFYPPKAGFLRLFCQVQRDGKDIMAPFGVTVMD